MTNFFQLNYMTLIAFLVFFSFFVWLKIYLNKIGSIELNYVINTFGVIVAIYAFFVIASTVLHNQVPKTKLDTSYVEQSTNRYQESVIRNTNQGK